MTSFRSGFASVIDSYMKFRIATGFSNHHAKLLKRFDRYCATFHPDECELQQRIVKGWLDYEAAHGYLGMDQKVGAIRSLAKYMGADAFVAPTSYIPKRNKYVPYVLTDDELGRLFNAIDSFHNKDPFFSLSIRVMFRMIYSCGLRPNEGRNIQVSDVDFQTGEVFIRQTKRRKDRIVVVSDDMLVLLSKFHSQRAILAQGDGFLFSHGDSRQISARELTGCLKKCWAMANPEIDERQLPRLRVYDLRHRFASTNLQRWLDEGENLYAMLPYLRAYMGHVRFEDTAYYIHILPDRLIKSPGVNWESIDRTSLEVSIWRK